MLYAKEIKKRSSALCSFKNRIISCAVFHLYQLCEVVHLHSLRCDLNINLGYKLCGLLFITIITIISIIIISRGGTDRFTS